MISSVFGVIGVVIMCAALGNMTLLYAVLEQIRSVVEVYCDGGFFCVPSLRTELQ